MTFQTALSAGNYTSLRGNASTPARFHAKQFISLCPNTVVFKCRVNQASFAASFAQFTWDGATVGAYTDAEIGQTIYVSHTDDINAAFFRGRIRKAATTTIVYINETSAAFADNDYVFVVDDFDLHYKLARDVEASGVATFYKDYDVTYRGVNPIITNLQSAYVGVVSGTPTGFTQQFIATAIAGTSGATISSYAYTIKSGMTVTAGSASTNSVTIRFDAGHYWLKLVVTDSAGRTTTRRIEVFSVPVGFGSQVELGFQGAEITCDVDEGYSASITGFAGITSTLDRTRAVIWSIPSYNGTEGALTTNVEFVGRLRVQHHRLAGGRDGLNETRFDLEGIGQQLASLPAPSITFREASSPTVWDEITLLTWWREMIYAIDEHSTLASICAVAFDDTSASYRELLFRPAGESMLAVLNRIAEGIDGKLEFAPDGRIEIGQRATVKTTAQRGALTTVAAHTTQDYIEYPDLEIDPLPKVSSVQTAGGFYNSNTGIMKPMLSIAPGIAPGEGVGQIKITDIIVASDQERADAHTELNRRTGHILAEKNASTRLRVQLWAGYYFLVPTRRAWFTWTLAAATNPLGKAYTTSERWTLESITHRHDNHTGARDVEATYVLETTGDPGDTVKYQPQGTSAGSTPYVPDIPPLAPFPGFPTDPIIIYITPPSDPTEPTPVINPPTPTTPIPDDGNAVIIGAPSNVWSCQDFISSASPNWNDITPTLASGYTIRHIALAPGSYRVYVLASDGTDSQVATCTNAWADTPDWTWGATVTGEYTEVKVTSTSDSIYIYSVNAPGGSWTQDFDFTIDAGGGAGLDDWQSRECQPFGGGWYGATYVAATGWNSDGTTASHQNSWGLKYYVPYDATFTNATLTWTSSAWANANVNIELESDCESLPYQAFFSASGVEVTFNAPLDVSAGEHLMLAIQSVSPTGDTHSCTAIQLKGTGVNPFTGVGTASGAKTAYSDDNGATFATPLTVGNAPGVFGGFDVLRIGNTALAGNDGQVDKATTLGGTWSAYGSAMTAGTQPNAIVIPRYIFGSTSSGNVTTATPEYLVGSAQAVSNAALWKVTASGATFTDITPSIAAVYGLTVSPHCLAMPWFSGARIAALLLFDATVHLVTSLDSGGTWTDRGAIDGTANMVTFRRGDQIMKQLFIANGVPNFSLDYGATLTARTYPSSSTTNPVLWICPYG